MSAQRVELLLEIKEKLDGLTRTQEQVAQFQNQLTSLGQLMKAGFAIDAAARINSALASVPAAIERTIKAGLDFNAALEQNRIAIAAALRSSDPGSLPSFSAALAKAGQMFDLIKTAAKSAGLDSDELAKTFAGTTAILTRANVPLARQVELLTTLSKASQVLGVRAPRQQIAAMLAGHVTENSILASALNVRKEDLEAAGRSGRMLEYLTEQSKGFAEGAKQAASSWDVLKEKFGGQWKAGATAATKGLFEDLKGGMKMATQSGAIKATGESIGELYDILRFAGKQLVDGTVVWAEVGKRLLQGERYFGHGGIRDELTARFDKYRDRAFGREDGPGGVPEARPLAADPFGAASGAMLAASIAARAPEISRALAAAMAAASREVGSLYAASSRTAMQPPDSLARRGIYVSASVQRYQDSTLEVQKGMLAVLQRLYTETERSARAIESLPQRF